MSTPHDEPPSASDPEVEPSEDEDRAAILKRRASFVASAIAGLSLATMTTACPEPCLDVGSGGFGGTGGEGASGGECEIGGAGGTGGAGTAGGCETGGAGGQ